MQDGQDGPCAEISGIRSDRQQQAACRTAMRFLVGIKQVGGGTEHHWPHPHLQPVVNL